MNMPRILLIEDDENLRFILAEVLVEAGYEVYEAEEGEDALATASGQMPDLVVTDIVMPGMEGIAAIMALRDRYDTIPIIAISGHELYLDSSEKLGADAALLKPFSHDSLIQTVRDLLPAPGAA